METSFDPICTKTLYSLSPTPVTLHIKFDQDWPTGLRDTQVQRCGWRKTTTDGRPMVSYKLTVWAFGSGKLIKPIILHFDKALFIMINVYVKFLKEQNTFILFLQCLYYYSIWILRKKNSTMLIKLPGLQIHKYWLTNYSSKNGIL